MAGSEMRVVELNGFGGPEVLTHGTRPIPEPGPGELLIQVAATGFNRADVSQRQGNYPPPSGASDLLGLECAGIVAAVGEGTRRFRKGDRVCALLAGGGYAEYVVVPEPQVLPLPQGVDLIEGAGIIEVAATILSNFAPGGPQRLAGRGTSALVHGGSGGLGTFAIRFGAALGWRMLATAGSTIGAEHCIAVGAEAACNYRERDFAEFVHEHTQGRGVDLILDVVGGPYLERNLGALAFDGRLIIVSTIGGAEAKIDLRHMMRRRLTLQATTLRARPVTGPGSKAEVVAAVEQVIWPMIADKRLQLPLALRMGVESVRQLHEAHENRTLPSGKAILVFDPSLD